MTVLQTFTTARSGSIGDLVHSHNQYGPYVRARTVPTDPATPLQDLPRRAWGQAGFRWHKVLTHADRQLWRDYAVALWKFSPRLKRRYHTGQQLHQRLNMCRRNDRTLGWLPQPPTELRAPVWTEPFVIDDTATSLILVIADPGDGWFHDDDGALVLFVSEPRPATVNFYKGPWRIAGVKRGSSSPGNPATSIYVDPWGSGSPGHRFCRFYVIQGDGRVTSPRARLVDLQT